ncbi:MAG: polyprenyl synthetase family protein [Muribaculaceae bacterium]|nr:polyprenyl synthetase family protein [Muribaculaceae bacterium]MDE6315283.1 polyprenyl synthetase family protein [Muribaculaceae bacterium]
MPDKSPSALEIIQQSIAPELRSLNQRIMLALSSPNRMMNKIIEEYLRRKGKQVRPIMVLLSARLFASRSTDSIIDAAASVEMLHNASLIHDDVVDESKLRRNEPTINGIWDNHIAVLVGDFFTATSLRLASETRDLRIIDTIAGLGRLLSIGELDQVYNARFHSLSEQAYMETIGRKTASLFVACASMGAYAAGADDSDPRLKAIRDFAEKLGLCFQIADDIFDYFPSAADTIGKPTGNDLLEGKVTLPLLHVLGREELPDHDRMLAMSRIEPLSPDQVAVLTDYAVRHGGIDYSRSVMDRLRHEAAAELTAAFADSPARQSLLALLDYVISRSH